MKATVKDAIIETMTGDISEISADAIVNAANSGLWMGSGVAGAIRRRGGKEIEEEALRQGPIDVGAAVETTAGRLNAKWVIHAAAMGPDLATDSSKIRDATRSALRKATSLGAKSIAFPLLGTGVGGFPIGQAADIMISEIIVHIQTHNAPRRVLLVAYSDDACKKIDEALSGAMKRI